MKKAKIIATIRDTYDEEKLIAIYNAWANIVRFNFPHAQYETTAPVIQLIHKLNAEWKTNLWIMIDTKGPGVRTWARENPYKYSKWESFRIFTEESKLTEDSDMFCDYPYLLEDIKVGNIIAIESGLMEVEVNEINTDYITVTSKHNCEIWSRRHMNFPGMNLRFPWLTDQDKKDVLFWLENGIQYLAISFVRTKWNIEEVRDFLHQNNADHIQIIAKIENQEWLENAESIAQVSDSIMIARWDLWIEVPTQKLPYYQRYLLDICQRQWKPAIMATELLKTMVHSPIPTRAEISDVYNSRFQWADVLMLSEETAIGEFPSKAVKIMAETIEEAESHMHNNHKDFSLSNYDEVLIQKKALVKHALCLADELWIEHILVFSHSWKFPKLVAAAKPNQTVYAFSPEEKVIQWMHLLAWIKWIKLSEWKEHTSENQEQALQKLKEWNRLKQWEKIIIIGDKKQNWNTDPLIKITTVN